MIIKAGNLIYDCTIKPVVKVTGSVHHMARRYRRYRRVARAIRHHKMAFAFACTVVGSVGIATAGGIIVRMNAPQGEQHELSRSAEYISSGSSGLRSDVPIAEIPVAANVLAVPEPTSLIALLSALAYLGAFRLWRKI